MRLRQLRWEQGIVDLQRRIAGVAKALLRLLLETSAQQCSHRSWRMWWKRVPVGLRAQDPRYDVGNVLTAKRTLSAQHFVQHAAKRPDIGAFVDRLPACLFRRHIRHRAEQHADSGHWWGRD